MSKGSKTKRLNLTVIIGSLSTGGGQQVVYELIKKIDPRKVSIHVICYEGKIGSCNETELERICSVIYLNEAGRITFGRMRRVFAVITSTNPDVVHAHLGGMAYAVPWALIKRRPLLITAHTKPSQAFIPFVLPGIRYGLKHRSIRIAAVSEENLRLLKEYFGIQDERLIYVNNGVDLDRFSQKEHASFTFLNVAWQDDNKNQTQIIRCFEKIHRKYPDIELVLVGDGPCHEDLRSQINELGLEKSIFLPGMKSNTEDYYATSDVYVQSSYREALSMSVLEAMASGLPIISTDVGGMRDVVRDNGVIVAVGDDSAMIAAMEKMISMDIEMRKKMGQSSKHIVKNYSSEQMAEKYVETYFEMWS